MRIILGFLLAMLVGAADADYSGPPIQIVIQATGIVADGVTDNASILAGYLAAMPASGGILQLPAGSIYINASAAGNIFIVRSNICVVGQGAGSTTLIPNNNSTLTTFLFTVNGSNACFHDFGISNQMLGSGASIAFLINGSNCVFSNLLIEGNNTPSAQNGFSAFELGTTFNGMAVDNSTIRDVQWGLFNTNTNTATHTNIKFVDDWFYGNFADDLAFNAPQGLMEGIFINGNRFENNLSGPTYGTGGIMLGMASAHDYRIIGNEFVGSCTTDAIHLEQDGERIVIAGNTFNLSVNTCNGIDILANNVGGTAYGIVGMTISGNTIVGGGSAGTGRGVWIQNNGSTASSAIQDAITTNVISGFFYGIYDETSRKEIIESNILLGNSVGLAATKPLTTMADNLVRDNSTGATFTYGGVLGRNDFQNNTVMIGVPSGVGRITENGLTQAMTSVSIPTGTSNVTLMPAGSIMNGILSVELLNIGTPNQASAVYSVSYNGTTLTASQISTTSSGGWTMGALAIVGGNLVFSATNGGGSSINTDIDVSLTGSYEY